MCARLSIELSSTGSNCSNGKAVLNERKSFECEIDSTLKKESLAWF